MDVTPENFSAVAIFLRADWVVKVVMIGLALASLWSWGVIIDKLIRFGGLNREADRFEDQVSSGQSLEDVAAAAGDKPRHPLPRMLKSALHEWRDGRHKGPMTDTQAALLIQRVDRALDSVISRESAKAEDGLGSLAIIATAIGLAAAIPAYIAYNKFSTDAGKFTGRLEGFADDMAAAVARRVGGGA